MTTARRDLKISGPFDAKTVFIERLAGKESLGTPFEYELTILSLSAEIDLSTLIGETVTATMEVEGGRERHFNGYVTTIALVDTFDRHARYRLKVRPFIWLMSPRINSRIFQNKSIPDIVKALFREHGFSEFEDVLAADYPSREYVVQYGESDFAFVSRLMEGAGIYYFFRHQADRHVLVLADSEGAHAPAPGYEEVPFYPASLPRTQRARDNVGSWIMEQQLRSGSYTSDDFDFVRPRAELMAKHHAETRHKKGDQEIYDYPGGFEDHAAGEVVVRTRLQEVRRDVETAAGTGDARGLGAGTVFDLTGYPLARQNKRYLIVSATFEIAVNAHESGEAEPPMEFRIAFNAIDSRVPFRPARTTAVPRIEGPQTAIVVGKGGEEIWTDRYGRVKVQFHWDREGGHNESSSCWVRVAQVWAGSQWGGIHVPRIGQEVLVDFLEGDPDRPIVTGRVYNGDNMVPYDLPANQTQSGIKSRSSKGGGPNNFNELRFEDKKGAEQVFVQAEKDLEILVKNDEHRAVGHDRKKDVANNETTTVGGSRSESVGKDESIGVGGSRTETVGKNESVGIGGSRSHSVDKDESVSVAGSRTLTVGKDDSTSVSGTQSVDVAKDQSTSISGGRTITISKDDAITVAGKRSVDVSKDEVLTVGKKLLLDAGDEIVVKSGDASITLKKNGDITIKGKNIVLDGSGKISVKASGDVNVKGSKVTQN